MKRSQKFIALLAIFALPMIGSWLVYTYHTYFHLQTTNHGSLVIPPVQVGDLERNALAHKQWVVAYAPSHCSDVEANHVLFELHQLRKALGESAYRVSIVLWDNQTCLPRMLSDAERVMLSHQQLRVLQEALHQEVSTVMDKIYLIDPLGNLFMYYPANTDAMNIYSDVKKVLGVSQIG